MAYVWRSLGKNKLLASVGLGLLLSSCGPARPVRVGETVGIGAFNSCHELTKEWGRRPIPDCITSFRPAWTRARSVQYRFNAEGVRGPAVSAPLNERTRILLMGPVMDGFGRPEDQMPARTLERLLAAVGRPAEVINASVIGFSTPRSVRFAQELLPKYQPARLFYFLSTRNIIDDYLESRTVDPFDAASAPFFARALWDPGDKSLYLWARAWQRMNVLRELRSRSSSRADETGKMQASSVAALAGLRNSLKGDQKLTVVLAGPPQVFVSQASELGWAGPLIELLTPALWTDKSVLERQLREVGLDVVVLGKSRPARGDAGTRADGMLREALPQLLERLH